METKNTLKRVFLVLKHMSQSKTRYFKITEYNTGTFQMLETDNGDYIQTIQITGLETRCRGAKRGFHFWVFLPDKVDKLKCLACGNLVDLKPKPKPQPPENTDENSFATP